MIDIWEELQGMFGVRADNLYPGILVTGLDHPTQQYILQYLCQNLRDIGPSLNNIITGKELYPDNVDDAINTLLSDEVDGMLWIETRLDGLTLPQIGFFVPSQSSLTIHYTLGMWRPVSLIGLFELLRWINDLGDHITLEMEEGTAPEEWRLIFDRVWKAYLADKGQG